ncbi:hypothetical protein IEE94_07885 [Yimella sp. cx-573]|nr:hypothetical protein [Yimella sp. cx-573]
MNHTDNSTNSPYEPFADLTGEPRNQRELSVPEANQRRWSGKKTAVVAAMAIGLATAGAATASATVPLGSSLGSDSGRGGFGGPGGQGGFRGGPPGSSQGTTGQTSQQGNAVTPGQFQGGVPPQKPNGTNAAP